MSNRQARVTDPEMLRAAKVVMKLGVVAKIDLATQTIWLFPDDRSPATPAKNKARPAPEVVL